MCPQNSEAMHSLYIIPSIQLCRLPRMSEFPSFLSSMTMRFDRQCLGPKKAKAFLLSQPDQVMTCCSRKMPWCLAALKLSNMKEPCFKCLECHCSTCSTCNLLKPTETLHSQAGCAQVGAKPPKVKLLVYMAVTSRAPDFCSTKTTHAA